MLDANPPMTVADLNDHAVIYAFESQGLSDLFDLPAIENLKIRQLWDYDSSLVLDVAVDGHKLPEDEIYSYPQFESVS